MTKAGPAAEPSMEEILASIRRIISDGDDAVGREGEAAMGDTATAEAADSGSRAEAARDIARQFPRDDDGEDDEIFELTDDMLAEEAVMEGGDTAISRGGRQAPWGEPADEAVEAAPTVMPTVEPRQPDVAFGSGWRDARDAAEAENAASAPDEVRATPPSGTGGSEPGEAAPARDAGGDHLLSPASDAKVTSAFNQLASTILMKDARTLDDLVQEMLRPMLKEWLDDNLPQLVERLVREEIQRVSRGRG